MRVDGKTGRLYRTLTFTALAWTWCGCVFAQQSPEPAATLLLHPSGVAIDSVSGAIYFAERDAHRIRRLTSAGSLETVAGTGVQGFKGDGGLATQAELNSPQAVALSQSGDLYIADTGNDRIRRLDVASGQITTIAGDGRRTFAGDGGPAAAAALSRPRALALDPAGDLVIADSGNQRVRCVDVKTSVITTLVGSGAQGSSGDGGPGLTATLNDPGGVAYDAAGDLYIADTGNSRIRMLDPKQHLISSVFGGTGGLLQHPSSLAVTSDGHLLIADSKTHRVLRADPVSKSLEVLAGTGVEAFAGEGVAAAGALLDAPSGVAVAADGSVLVADGGNNRLRGITASSPGDASIWTVAGSGAQQAPSLGPTLSGPSSSPYGSGVVTVTTPAGNAPSGSVTLQELTGSGATTLMAEPVVGGAATIHIGTLPAGSHRLQASYLGNATHLQTVSNILAITVAPLPLLVTPTPAAMLFGQSTPPLAGIVTGLLPQDNGKVSATFSAAVDRTTLPGEYPIQAALTGPGAPNYTVQTTSASVTVSKAPSALALAATTTTPSLVTVRAVAATSGVPSGTVQLYEGSSPLTSGTLGADGAWTVAPLQLAPGPHQLQAAYAGDQRFLPAVSSSVSVTLPDAPTTTPSQADFSVSVAGTSSLVSVLAGGSAAIPLKLTPLNGSLASPVVLSSSGLPAFATGNFDPPVLPPGNTTQSFTLHIATAPIASNSRNTRGRLPLMCAMLVSFWCLQPRRWRRSALLALLCFSLLLPLSGCGNRIAATGENSSSPTTTYNVVITATATSADGRILQHSAAVQVQIIN